MDQISEHYIVLEKVLEGKGIKAPGWVVRMLERLLHVEEINQELYKHRTKEGVAFAQAILDDLHISVRTKNAERIPKTGRPVFVANHPLGGPDGLALIAAIGAIRDDIVFPVNDFLMHIPQLKPLFVAIDKVHGNRATALEVNKAFSSDKCVLYFPAGLCSRRIKGKIVDLEWKPTVVKKAIAQQRDLIPIHIKAHNRRRFYTIANMRKMLGIKFNFEMALLPSEMFAQQGNTFEMSVGEPIAWQKLDNGMSPQDWTSRLHDLIYTI